MVTTCICIHDGHVVVFRLWQTLEFELRKLEAQQALQQVDLLKTFMPNSFLVSGGELYMYVL